MNPFVGGIGLIATEYFLLPSSTTFRYFYPHIPLDQVGIYSLEFGIVQLIRCIGIEDYDDDR